MQAGLGADVDRDVGVKRQVLPRDDLVLGRVHPVLLPGVTGLGEHVEPWRGGGVGTKKSVFRYITQPITPSSLDQFILIMCYFVMCLIFFNYHPGRCTSLG